MVSSVDEEPPPRQQRETGWAIMRGDRVLYRRGGYDHLVFTLPPGASGAPVFFRRYSDAVSLKSVLSSATTIKRLYRDTLEEAREDE
jgi:hypothetical protein